MFGTFFYLCMSVEWINFVRKYSVPVIGTERSAAHYAAAYQ